MSSPLVKTNLILTGPLEDCAKRLSLYKDVLCEKRMRDLGYKECLYRGYTLYEYSMKHLDENYVIVGYNVQKEIYNIESPNVWYYKTSAFSKSFKADDFWKNVKLPPF